MLYFTTLLPIYGQFSKVFHKAWFITIIFFFLLIQTICIEQLKWSNNESSLIDFSNIQIDNVPTDTDKQDGKLFLISNNMRLTLTLHNNLSNQEKENILATGLANVLGIPTLRFMIIQNISVFPYFLQNLVKESSYVILSERIVDSTDQLQNETEQTELYFKYLQSTYVADSLLANEDAANMMNSMFYRSSASSSSYIRIDFSTALGNKHRPDLNIYEHHSDHHHSSSSSKHHTDY